VLVDFERRGVLDLFVGTGGGRIAYYRNTGTSTAPQFVLQTNFFQSIDVGDDAKPTFADLDGDGRLDLVIGSRDSSLSFWRNDGGTMTWVADFFAGIPTFPRTAPAFLDIDEDGALDLFLGNHKGGLYFYRNRRHAANGDGAQQFQLYQNYPNPFNTATVISFDMPEEQKVSLRVYDILGREIAVLLDGIVGAGTHAYQFDGRGLSSGLFFYRLSAGSYGETKKMQLVK